MRFLFQAAILLIAASSCRAQEQAPAPSPTELRQRAHSAENQQQYGPAADAFLALVRAEPDRADWTVAAGRCLVRARRFRDAVETLDAARRRFPSATDVRAMLAFAMLAQAENDRAVLHPEVLFADAADLAEQVVAERPDDEESRLVLAQARWQLGEADAAVQQAEEVVRRHPHRPGGHVLLGRIAGDRLRALLAEYEAQQPTGQAAADFVARIDAERRRARAAYGRAAELDPLRAHPHVALAQLAWADKDIPTMRRHAADALAIDPDAALDHDLLARGMPWQERADFYGELQKRYAATTLPRPAKAATLRFHEGRARFEGRDWAAARACFEATLSGNPDARHAHYYAFLAAYETNDHDAAERHAHAYAAASAPGFADVVRALVGDRRGEVGAIVRFLADRAFAAGRREASRDLNHVIACLADSADAWNNHAFLCRETGRFDDALSSYQHALEKEPDSPQLLNDCGVILQYHLPSPEHRQKARGLYERALRLADQQLASGGLAEVVRERVQKARADAKANLAALDK